MKTITYFFFQLLIPFQKFTVLLIRQTTIEEKILNLFNNIDVIVYNIRYRKKADYKQT